MSYTLLFSTDNHAKLEEFSEKNCFDRETPGQYQFSSFKKGSCRLVLYDSGKLVIQGKQCEHYYNELLDFLDEKVYSHYGSDEAGKGDLFGPLVICAVYMSEKDFKTFRSLGFQESKNTKGEKLKKQAKLLKETLSYETVFITPKKYNELYLKFNNLNKLMRWAHTTALKNLLTKVNDKNSPVYIDQFAKNMRFDITDINEVIQETKAEKHPAVAAASLICKSEFILWLEKKSKELGIKLPAGASNVKGVAFQIVEKYGVDTLKDLTKNHFKTYGEIINKCRG